MRFPSPPKKRTGTSGLRTERQIALYRKREAAKQVRAQRRAEEARVRHLNFELVQRIVLLVFAVVVGVAAVIGAASDPELLKLALGAGGVWGAIAAALYRGGSRPLP